MNEFVMIQFIDGKVLTVRHENIQFLLKDGDKITVAFENSTELITQESYVMINKFLVELQK